MTAEGKRGGWGPFGIYGWHGDWVTAGCEDPLVDVSLKIEQVNGVPEVVALHLGAPGSLPPPEGLPDDIRLAVALIGQGGPDGRPWPQVVLTHALLKELPIGRLKAAALAHRHGLFSFSRAGSPGKGPTPVSEERLRKAAAIYLEAPSKGLNPTAAVKDAFGLSRAGASRYIKMARDHDPQLLEYPEKQGVSGVGSKKSPYPKRPTKNPRPSSGIT